MPRRYRELWYSLIAIAAITGLYVLAYLQRGTFPVASSLVGHGIGIVGFILMLMTATLYSIRKLATDARWGSMAAWLRFHMVTGLLGPYMVLLHTSMRFHGLAGVAMLLTVVVVISGLVGRYVYAAVPRAIDGAEPGVGGVDRRFALSEAPLTAFAAQRTAATVLEAPAAIETPRVAAGGPSLDRLLARRGALATWRTIHLPLTWALFVAAFVHVVGALYYMAR